MGSAAQQAALQCYCLQFKPQDHSFLLQSNVFTNISKALSLTEENQDITPPEKKMRDKVIYKDEIFTLVTNVGLVRISCSSKLVSDFVK